MLEWKTRLVVLAVVASVLASAVGMNYGWFLNYGW